jgi:tetratricopeptide (TPR) repeat protein
MNHSIIPMFEINSATNISNSVSGIRSNADNQLLERQAVVSALYFLGLGKKPSVSTGLVRIAPQFEAIVTLLTTIMEQFLLAHEYAHVALGHLGNRKNTLWPIRNRGRILEQSREMEFAADRWAQDTIVGAHDDLADLPGLGTDGYFSAPSIAFLYFDFLRSLAEQVSVRSSSLKVGDHDLQLRTRLSVLARESISTHPTDRERFEALNSTVIKHGAWHHMSWIEGVEHVLADMIARIPEILNSLGYQASQQGSDALIQHVEQRNSKRKDVLRKYSNFISDTLANGIAADTAMSAINTAQEQLDAGRALEARKTLRSVIESTPDGSVRAFAVALLARVNVDLMDYDAAIECIRSFSKINQDADSGRVAAVAAAAAATAAVAAIFMAESLPGERSADRLYLYKLAYENTHDAPYPHSIAGVRAGIVLIESGRGRQAQKFLRDIYKNGHEEWVLEAAVNLSATLVADPSHRPSNSEAVRLAQEVLSSGRTVTPSLRAVAALNLGIAYRNLGKRPKAVSQLEGVLSGQGASQAIRTRAAKELEELRKCL